MPTTTLTALQHLTSAQDEMAHALHFADALRMALVNTTPEMEAALNMVLAGVSGAAEYVTAAQGALRHA